MIVKNIKIPYYDFDLYFIQIEGKEDAKKILLRQGIAELGSGSKTPKLSPRRSHAINPRISSL